MRTDHQKYIEKKENATIELYKKLMIDGYIFQNIESLKGLFSDFEKPMSVKPDTESSQDTKPSKNKTTNKNNIKFKRVEHG